jgi:1-acyl-sn-glycerol-3-phosphate acyltransferase
MKKLLGRIYLTCGGWRQIGEPPREAKYIIVAAPHTSGWDLPPLLGFAWVNGIKLSWMGKHTLFAGRWGWLFRWLGGIPIDRRSRNGVVAQMAVVFEESDRLALAIPVEGTREYREYWKSGFYYIAKQTGVPIVLTVLDWSRKEGGFGPTIWPSDDLSVDMDPVRAFYEGRRGKYDGQFSRVRLREEEDPSQVSSGP